MHSIDSIVFQAHEMLHGNLFARIEIIVHYWGKTEMVCRGNDLPLYSAPNCQRKHRYETME